MTDTGIMCLTQLVWLHCPMLSNIAREYICHNVHAKASYSILVNRALIKLDLSGNELRLDGCKVVCEIMKSNETIKDLALANNGFQTKSAQAIAEMLQVNRGLIKLNISNNAITFGEKGWGDMTGVQALAEALPKT